VWGVVISSASSNLNSEAGMNDKREIRGWMLYDWANSAFSTTVVTVFLGPYLTGLIQAQVGETGTFQLLGLTIAAKSFFTYCVSASVFLQVFFLPILGAIADYSHLKRKLMAGFAVAGAACTIGLFFISGELYVLGGLLFIVANLCFGASIVFYNAFLPQIATEDQRDRVSSGGWAWGYAGGGLLLLINLGIYLFRDKIGLDGAMAARINLASAGVWWLIFGWIAISRLRDRGAHRSLPEGHNFVSVAFHQLRQTFSEMRKYPMTLRYLIAYLLFNDGIQTVIVVAALFGDQELKMATSDLTLVILMVQFVGVFGALGFGRLAERIGDKKTIVITLLIWSATSIWAVVSLRTVGEFWLLAAVIALVLGGSQALSRALFSRMIPRDREAEFFSFYEISERGTSWIGPLLFGLVTQATNSMRTAIFSLIVLFVSGLLILLTVDVKRAMHESGNDVDTPMEIEGESA
jgi:UMF1 family MFS transporter